MPIPARRIPTQPAIHPCGRSARPGGQLLFAGPPYPARGVPRLLAGARRPGPVRLPAHRGVREDSPTDGAVYTVQYFERNRFEFHPENAGRPMRCCSACWGATSRSGARRRGAFPARAGPARRRLPGFRRPGTTWRRSSRRTGRRTAGWRSTATRSARPSPKRAHRREELHRAVFRAQPPRSTTPNCPARTASAWVYSGSRYPGSGLDTVMAAGWRGSGGVTMAGIGRATHAGG